MWNCQTFATNCFYHVLRSECIKCPGRALSTSHVVSYSIDSFIKGAQGEATFSIGSGEPHLMFNLNQLGASQMKALYITFPLN